ncbi:DUF300-domain-containing protein [Lophiostoma macrostomum CBS 122681]|uniref:DUF300-domain-containing protein n=1 Tax=Lophiostoma macrostomum CBS 122681 TaxID=1314788 RepID=A0A6A6TF32_9PLEO|nr:DUF300-domain-containing protein [Lophiostoma macrostomum CBS 122681]
MSPNRSPNPNLPWPVSQVFPRAFSKNATCESAEQEDDKVSKEPLWKGGLTFHHLGLIISATFGAIAIAISLFMLWRHATHYLKPWEQKHIIRILVMIPIYALVSFLSYLNYHHAIYFEVLRDCYEAFAIASFFTLMCHYIAPDLHQQKQYFRDITPKNWVWPLTWIQKCTGGENKGFLRKPRSGLTWFNIVWVAVFQYCFIRVFFTIVAVVTQATGRYCQSSKDPRFAYIWVAGFEAISVTIAMYCLIQFYIQLKQDLAPHRPFLKILCIKLVIFFCFWQSWIISLLTTDDGPLKPTKTIGGPDWRIGLPSMLVCVEMAFFAVLHIFAFPWSPYDLRRRQETFDEFSSGGAPKTYASGALRALLSALNPWDIVKAFSRGARWLFVGVRHRKDDISYQTKLEPVSTSYDGPTFAGNGEAATEFRPGRKDSAPGRSENLDTYALLSDAQANPLSRQDQELGFQSKPHGSNPYAALPNPDSLPPAPSPGQEYGVMSGGAAGGAAGGAHTGTYTDFETQQPYLGASQPGRIGLCAMPSGEQQDDRPSGEWDMFAGARPGAGAGPPPYSGGGGGGGSGAAGGRPWV